MICGKDTQLLDSLKKPGRGIRVAIVGASGGIGGAFSDILNRDAGIETLFACSRNPARADTEKIRHFALDITDEASILETAGTIGQSGELDLILTASGILHADDGLQPEKDWRQIDPGYMAKVLAVNTIGPALVLKHFAPILSKQGKSVFAALSARVGSISDNRLGGWYAYRASKAALNQIIRTAAIELARKRKEAAIIGLHPGTVETALSEPFRGNSHDRFTPEESAKHLLNVIDRTDASSSGRVYDWQGIEVPA